MKKKGKDFEKLVQKCLNSGSLWFDKGDLKTEDFLIECKTTKKKSFRITTKILRKIWNDALDRNKLPKLVIGIEEDDSIWLLAINIVKKRIN